VRTEERLAESLRLIAADTAPGRLPADLWSKGRRRRRTRLAGGAAAVAVLAALVVVPLAARGGGGHGVPPAEPMPAVPRVVHTPFPFTSTVQHSPHGPAALVVSGVGAFHGSDVFTNYEGRNVVVSPDGISRKVNLYNEIIDAGYGSYLSPDGHLLATDTSVQGADDETQGGLAVLDLTTGAVRTYPVGGSPIAWSPTGRSVLVSTATGGQSAGGLRLVNLEYGVVRDLSLAIEGDAVAFSPDGWRLAVQVGPSLWIVNVATAERREIRASVGQGRRLAGPGAWTSDGRLALADAGLSITYLDVESGAEVTGPRLDRVTGSALRLLGWQADGDAVVAVFQPPPPPALVAPHDLAWVSGVQLLALHPGGGRTELVDLPGDVLYVDVARDLLVADRFGGPGASLPARWADWAAGLRTELTVLAGLVVLVVAVRLRRRIRALLRRWFAARRAVRSGSP